jgi:4'-phosphopantetheinyl transferase
MRSKVRINHSGTDAMVRVYNEPSLDGGDVHVWRSSLDVEGEVVARLERLLSEDEKKRASRYANRSDRDAFIVARGTLRRILAAYLSVAPKTLEFKYNEFGKPSLGNREKPSPLHFNTAHSGRIVLFAVSFERRVGIDIEHIHAGLEWESIAQYYFTSDEFSKLLSLPPAQRSTAFVRLWVRKEAYAKALGMGLGFGLDYSVPQKLDR